MRLPVIRPQPQRSLVAGYGLIDTTCTHQRIRHGPLRRLVVRVNPDRLLKYAQCIIHTTGLQVTLPQLPVDPYRAGGLCNGQVQERDGQFTFVLAYQVLGPLHQATAYDRLTRMEFVTADRSVRRATYGEGGSATTVVVNFGEAPAEIAAAPRGRVVLPRWGFVIESPRFAAFHASRWGEEDDRRDGALFTIRALYSETLESADRVRIYHGFGSPVIYWRGNRYEVQREEIVDA